MDEEVFCTVCGRLNTEPEYKLCPFCRQRQRGYYRKCKGDSPDKRFGGKPLKKFRTVDNQPKRSLAAVVKMADERGISYGYMSAELRERGEER